LKWVGQLGKAREVLESLFLNTNTKGITYIRIGITPLVTTLVKEVGNPPFRGKPFAHTPATQSTFSIPTT
jgi:hypothetical protein